MVRGENSNIVLKFAEAPISFVAGRGVYLEHPFKANHNHPWIQEYIEN